MKKVYSSPKATRLAFCTKSSLLQSSGTSLGIHDEFSSQPSLSDGKGAWSSEQWSEE